MKDLFLLVQLLTLCLFSQGQTITVTSPDENLVVSLTLNEGKLLYNASLRGKELLEDSPLGLKGEAVDLSSSLKLSDHKIVPIAHSYNEPKIKQSSVEYKSNQLTGLFENEAGQKLEVIFQVSDNNIAFRYHVPQVGEPATFKIAEEATGFKFPKITTTFLTPQAPAMSGWMKTKPSYEEKYIADQAMGVPSEYGLGYTFPALFHVGDRGWVLVSETGVNGLYCGSKLSEGTNEGFFQLAFPEQGENNGLGSAQPTIAFPGYTPWRTITLGSTLKPIVETTISFDVVEPQYSPSKTYTFGRATWSWLEWQDGSINFDDQKRFVDLSAAMGYEFTLVDNWWDSRIGKEKVEELAQYAADKNVGLCLWYNSNGYWNDAPQGPKNSMNSATSRKKAMAWMQQIGIKGIKVDFFGGDKQETMKLYEDILADANDYGLVVIFHGCTLPRGWERMYPNFVGSEAVLASENLIFTQEANDAEAYNATLHPFIRNAVGSMDFGPVLLNKRHDKTNKNGKIRKTTETFQLATAILFQTPVQNFGITPNNLTDMPSHVIDFMKDIPTTWDQTVFLDGYPGKYVVLARRHGEQWYVAAINAENQTKTIELSLPMLKNHQAKLLSDTSTGEPQIESVSLKKKKGAKIKLTVLAGGGAIIVGR